MTELSVKLLASAILATLIKAGAAVAGHSIHWAWAGLIAFAVVFGGWLIIDGGVIE